MRECFVFPNFLYDFFSTKPYISRNKSYSILVLLTKYVCTKQYRDEDEALSKKIISFLHDLLATDTFIR